MHKQKRHIYRTILCVLGQMDSRLICPSCDCDYEGAPCICKDMPETGLTIGIKMDLFSKAHLAIKAVFKDVSISPEAVLENLTGLQDRISLMMEMIKRDIADKK